MRPGRHARILAPARAARLTAGRRTLPRIPISPEHAPRATALPRRSLLALCALVFALAAVGFLPALRQGFVLGDDDYNLVVNPRWRGLGLEQLRWMWTTFFLGHWQPLTWMSFGLEYELWGRVDAERMHAVNLALHASSAVLAFLLFGRLLGAALGARAAERPREVAWASALGALLWAAHPLRVESVVWATERRDLLSSLFLIATTLAWLRWVSGEGRGWLVASLALYALSLGSKAWGMTLPMLLLLLDVVPLRRLSAAGGGLRGLARLTLEKWPFIPLAAATAALAAAAQASEKAAIPLADHGLLARCAQAAYGVLFYPWKTLVPARLSTLYLLEQDLDPTRAVYLASGAAIVLLVASLWVLRKRWPAAAAACCAYVLLVSPVLGFLQSGAQKVADRYSYLALLPLYALLSGGLFVWLADRRRRTVVLPGALVLVCTLAALSWRQTRFWRDSLTLWTRAAELEPANYVAQHNVAAALRQLGRRAEARERARLSIAANPGRHNTYARFYVGLLWLEDGDFEAALAAWRDALAIDPCDITTLSVAPRELAQRGRAAEGLALLEAGWKAAPDETEIAGLLADFLWVHGERQRAEGVWRAGLERDPSWVAGHVGLGKALLSRNQVDAAEEQLRAALDLEPRRVDARVLLGRALRARGRVQEAESCWSSVLEREPEHAEAQALLRQSRESAAQGR